MGTDYLSGVGECLRLLAMDSIPIQEGRGGEGISLKGLMQMKPG